MSRSFLVEVETYGEGDRCVIVHTPKSELENWIQEDYDTRQEIVDDMFQADFNYNIKGDLTVEEIRNEVLGDRMGFSGQSGDYNYTITNICSIKPIDLNEIREKEND